jgi:conjugal transfer ATP-binding protein TraC
MFKKIIKRTKKTGNQQATINKPGKEQPAFKKGAPDIRDHMAPSLVKELSPKDLTMEGKAGDYMVEIGATSEFARYFRSFTAAMKTSTTYAGMYNQLFQGDFGEGNLDIAIHLRPSDESRTLHDLARMIAGLESDYELTNNTTQKAKIRDAIIDLQEQEKRIRRNIERIFFVSTQAVVSANNIQELKKFSNALIKRFAGQGVILRPNDRKQLPALTCTTVFDQERVFEDSFRHMESSCIADLFPFGQGGISHTDGVILGYDNYRQLVFLDPWAPGLPNAHMVVFGRAGAGKSFTIKILTLRSAIMGIRTGIIDPDRKCEYENLVRALNGSYIKLDSTSKHHINMFDVNIAEDENGQITVELEQSINAVQAIIFKMLNSIDTKLLEDGPTVILIREKIRQLYANFGITDDPESLFEARKTGEKFVLGERCLKKMPTLSDFHDIIENEPRLKKVAAVMKVFTKKGNDPVMSIFDCETNVDIKNDVVFAFSVGNLEETVLKPLGMFIATKWIKENFAYQNRFQKKRIIVDESQVPMKTPEMADWMEDSFRQMRKYNCSMVAASQGFEVFMQVPQGLGILKNATIKLILRQEPIDIDAVQGKFNLSEGEASFVLTSPKGTGILIVDNESTILNVLATAEEEELFTTDPNQLKEMAERQKRQQVN